MNFTRSNLQEFIDAQPVVNTHSHQALSLGRGGFNLVKCFRNSYVSWCGVAWDSYPSTRFVLLHCSSPWIDDTLALLRLYPNVYTDLSWLPQLTSRGAHKAFYDLIEAGAADKIGWGCDTWTPEESYGSLLAFRQVLTEVLVDKVEGGYLSLISAREIARRILYENARAIFNLRSLKRDTL